jgi:hypothetical protein
MISASLLIPGVVSDRAFLILVAQRDILALMADVTRILARIQQGDPAAADQLLPMVYGELRLLAAHKLSRERPGQTLEATALVHEAYVRLVDVSQAAKFQLPTIREYLQRFRYQRSRILLRPA